MSLAIRPLHPLFVVEISGVDLSAPLSKANAEAIERAIDEHGVAVFHNQHLSDEQQIAFSKNFGQMEATAGGHVSKPGEKRLGRDMADVSNLDQNNQPYQRDDRRRLFNLGNRLWHTDSSFRPVPAKYSILSARRISTTGGNTEFADMRAAYDALDQPTRARIEDLVCQHSLLNSRAKLGFFEFTDDERQQMQAVRQRLVRSHPTTGRKSLFLASHIGAIEGMPVAEALCFINDLLEHATQREFVYSHQWAENDLVVWDNRQMLHRVRAFDESKPRDMRRTTVAGAEPTIAQQPLTTTANP